MLDEINSMVHYIIVISDNIITLHAHRIKLLIVLKRTFCSPQPRPTLIAATVSTPYNGLLNVGWVNVYYTKVIIGTHL